MAVYVVRIGSVSLIGESMGTDSRFAFEVSLKGVILQSFDKDTPGLEATFFCTRNT